ncbi:tetratricopeptide repeat protein [Qipengyuania sediminis]|uniref:tetratricopeptide repeat protein n=1 Tax=Qipengyuania sediminis TaxID=1532023 RepID=UPI00105A8045|nr:tetratricopeptide repeat protein [Qipengyuania sediminis]
MSWLAILLLAAAAFALGALGLRLPRQGYTLLGAALLFGLAGYALQGEPGRPAAPSEARAPQVGSGAPLVEIRRELFGAAILPSRFLITSDAFARRGDFIGAAGFARSALADNPNDAEAWTALGNAMLEHAGGRMTPAAHYAYDEAERARPGHPAPAYFRGLAHLRAGEPERTLELWSAILAKAPPDAPWRAGVAARVAFLAQALAPR